MKKKLSRTDETVTRNGKPEAIKPRVSQTEANSGHAIGNAKLVIARPRSDSRTQACVFCRQKIEYGTAYVNQDRWLYFKHRWHEPGPRHRDCFRLEVRPFEHSTVKG
jgi:hypothetical protein